MIGVVELDMGILSGNKGGLSDCDDGGREWDALRVMEDGRDADAGRDTDDDCEFICGAGLDEDEIAKRGGDGRDMRMIK